MRALATYDLTKDYTVGFWRKRSNRALDRLTVDVESGEVVGFLGPNGAGKTTTLKLLMQLVYPTAGGAELLGRPVGDAAVRQRIGYLPESPYFYDYLTAEELLMYFASLFGLGAADSRMRAGRLLDELGIGAERRWPLRKFSKGMLQRIGVAQALVNDPELLILDEPMSGLDPIGRRDVRALILRLRDQGRTVFFSSHVLSDAEALCSRVVILAHGRMVASGTVSELVAFQHRGWELVVGSLAPSLLERIKGRVGPLVQVGPARYSIELPPEPPPHLLVSELAAAGAQIVSLNPIRDTLESVFIHRVADQGPDLSRSADARGRRSDVEGSKRSESKV